MSKRQASSLERTWVECNPSKWVPSFFREWSTFWNRDAEDSGVPVEAQPYLDLVPESPGIELPPVTAKDICDSVGELKAISMRGADGWSYGELKMIPAVAFNSLAAIFGWIESNRRWPTVLAQWFIILLRKSEVDTPSRSDLRPITVASSLYRLWARIRARRILAILRERGTGMVRVNLPTTTIWGFVSDFLDFHDHLGDESHPSGIVLDIVKAFNTLNRAILRELMRKAGIPIGFIDAWIHGLDQMTRRVSIQGNHFAACTGCTGVPEGDPLSVVAMWAFSRLFSCVVHAHSTPVLTTPVTYADNWEVLSGSCREVIALYPVLASFLETCRLPIAPRKCWAWAFRAADRKVLKQTKFGEEPLPVVLRQKDLGQIWHTVLVLLRQHVMGGYDLVRNDWSAWQGYPVAERLVSSARVCGNIRCMARKPRFFLNVRQSDCGQRCVVHCTLTSQAGRLGWFVTCWLEALWTHNLRYLSTEFVWLGNRPSSSVPTGVGSSFMSSVEIGLVIVVSLEGCSALWLLWGGTPTPPWHLKTVQVGDFTWSLPHSTTSFTCSRRVGLRKLQRMFRIVRDYRIWLRSIQWALGIGDTWIHRRVGCYVLRRQEWPLRPSLARINRRARWRVHFVVGRTPGGTGFSYAHTLSTCGLSGMHQYPCSVCLLRLWNSGFGLK